MANETIVIDNKNYEVLTYTTQTYSLVPYPPNKGTKKVSVMTDHVSNDSLTTSFQSSH